MEQSGLFGIFHSNRSSNDHWGKNCFNSSFPTAMACYMLAQNIPVIYLHLNNKLEVVADTLPVSQVFNCDGRALKELSFQFESVFETSLDKGTQRKTTENELPSLTQCTA